MSRIEMMETTATNAMPPPTLVEVTDAAVNHKYAADAKSRRKYLKQLGGCVVKNGNWWRLRYRQDVYAAGAVAEVNRSVKIAPLDEYRTLTALLSSDQLLQKMADLLAEAGYIGGRRTSTSVEPEKVTKLGEFVKSVYLPFAAGQLRKKTHDTYRDIWEDHLQRRLADRYLREVRTCDVQQVLDDIARTGKLTRQTLKNIKVVLSAMFKHAKRQGYFDGENPVRDTAIPRRLNGTNDEADTYAYALEEVLEMLRILPEPANTAVAIAAFTGVRYSELLGLQWQDFDGTSLRVSRSIFEGEINAPKTKKSKGAIPVIGVLKRKLEEHRAVTGKPKTGPILRNRSGEPLDLHNLLSRKIQPTLKRCAKCGRNEAAHRVFSRAKCKQLDHRFELDISRVQWHGWHSFRRGLATNLNRLGVPAKTIQAILRHAQISTTMNIYVKSVDADSVMALEKLEAVMFPPSDVKGTTSAHSFPAPFPNDINAPAK